MKMQKGSFESIFQKYVNNHKEFFFIQIGSNDGKTQDPLHKYIIKYNWKGILIEPVNYLFKRLLKTYHNKKGLTFKNVAISKKEGYRDFYRIKENNEANTPFWHNQLGSFNKEIVLKHRKLIPNFDKYLIKERVKCISFDKLIKENKVKNIDLLQIDTEGYDFEIIKLIDFKKLHPKVIIYEHKHLTKPDQITCMNYLKSKGYSVIIHMKDTFAILR